MKKKIHTGVDIYTPCKITECYYDDGENVEITSFAGTMKFHGLGRKVWILSDGSTTIGDMIEQIAAENQNVDKKEIKAAVVDFLDKLKEKQIVETNWDPLYKYDKEQRLYDE